MAYPLRDLLQVRYLREDEAKKELNSARQALEQAYKQLEESKKKYEDYKEWRKMEEQRLFEKILQKTIKRKKLDDVKVEVGTLRGRELEYKKAIGVAEAAVEKAKQVLEEKRIAYRKAIQERQKIEEHKEIWLEEWRKEQEFLAEKEMEDYRVRPSEMSVEE